MLSRLDMHEVKEHYKRRLTIHKTLVEMLNKGDTEGYVRLALGMSDPVGNYSAAEHHLGPMILQSNSPSAVYKLAEALNKCPSPRKVPEVIYNAGLPYLKISVGSEMAMMLRPSDFWVANVRTIWARLLIKHGDNYEKANEELMLYRDSERTSEMEYRIWADMHALLEDSLFRLNTLGKEEADRQGVTPGKQKYLWADAIANELYSHRTTL